MAPAGRLTIAQVKHEVAPAPVLSVSQVSNFSTSEFMPNNSRGLSSGRVRSVVKRSQPAVAVRGKGGRTIHIDPFEIIMTGVQGSSCEAPRGAMNKGIVFKSKLVVRPYSWSGGHEDKHIT